VDSVGRNQTRRKVSISTFLHQKQTFLQVKHIYHFFLKIVKKRNFELNVEVNIDEKLKSPC